MTSSKKTVPQSVPLSRDMVLARFIRLCSSVFSTPVSQEAAALIVNRISELARTDRAVLVRLKGKNPIVAVTGGGQPAQDTFFADAVETLRKRQKNASETLLVPKATDSDPHLWKAQQAMGGTRILWLPLWLTNDNSTQPQYALWLERWQGREWTRADVELLQHAALFLGHALIRPHDTQRNPRLFRWAILTALLIFLALPVSSSVTARAIVVPDRPHYIFAPMDGILKDLLVRPGQWVKKNELLFRYDARVLDKRLDESYRNVAVAKAKLAKLQGAAHRDPEARAELPVQELEVRRAEAEAKFIEKQRARADVRTAKPGVIVLDDPDALIGAAIQTGQAVMSVADPEQTKLQISVPASDAAFLKKGARVLVRLDSQPFRSIPALITHVGFDVKVSEDGVPSVTTEAVWPKNPPDVRPGQKSSAKISGNTTFMGMQILRKPLIGLRTLVGF